VKGLAKERTAIVRFARDLETRPPLTDASDYEHEIHSIQVGRLMDIFSMVRDMPAASRTFVADWDAAIGPLFHKLFILGADIDRFTLAEAWRPILLADGLTDSYLRATAAVASSLRNFYHHEEALEICREGRKAAGKKPSAALANLINMEGIVLSGLGQFDLSESCYAEAMHMAEGLKDEGFALWTRVNKKDFLNRLSLNVLDSYLKRGFKSEGRERTRHAKTAKTLLTRFKHVRLSETHKRLVLFDEAELCIIEGRLIEAKSLLTPLLTGTAKRNPEALQYMAAHARLLSNIASLQGDWEAAYGWIRKALKEGMRYCYGGEDQQIMEQVMVVLKGLTRETQSHGILVQDLVRLLEDKDWYTGRSHSHGVSRLATRLGEVLNATDGFALNIKTLETAGLLHDVGKLRTPWSLLNKPTPITPRERAFLEEHPVHGGDILRRIGMGDLAPIVEGHHELMDGSGYPHGKPPALMAATIGVSDVFEAATTPTRRYKTPKTRGTALLELTSMSGTRYNPQVVQALAKIVASGHAA
jgi:HD-GYP domain-containing protein (c-di-GMP phosphodiesterase class II)